jgi:hypothetical protein
MFLVRKYFRLASAVDAIQKLQASIEFALRQCISEGTPGHLFMRTAGKRAKSRIRIDD